MIVHRNVDDTGIREAVVTTGSFDGVHAGHRIILKRIADFAKERGGQSVLITFYPHPRKVLYPDTAGRELHMINTQEEKILLLEQTGIDHLLIIPFSLEFSKISSVDFIRRILVEKLAVSHVVVGFNHFFGHNREGDFELLRQLGRFYHFTVDEIPEKDIQNESVSSSKIRKALTEGNIQRANAYLEHPYFMMGSVGDYVQGDKIPNLLKLVMPDDDKLIPPPGAYAVAILHQGLRKKGIAFITADRGERSVLFTALDENPVVGFPCQIEFYKALQLGGLFEAGTGSSSPESFAEQVGELIY